MSRNPGPGAGSGLLDPADLAKPQLEGLTSMGIRGVDPVARSIRDGHERNVSFAGHIAHPPHTRVGWRHAATRMPTSAPTVAPMRRIARLPSSAEHH
jgi:hypothetical protein